MAKSNDEMFSCISAQALSAAKELRDMGDGPEKIKILREGSGDLLGLLDRWETSTHRPVKGSLYDTLFLLLSEAKSYSGMSSTARQKTIQFMKKALRLRMQPGTEGREKAIKFFQKLGESAGEEREKFLS